MRKMMLEELQRRNYAQNTIRHYIRTVEDFARRFRCAPDRLGPRQIREYQAELFQKRKLSANSVGQHLAALRFFYIKTLRRTWSLADTPYPKKTRHLPTILSPEEVAQLLHAARNPGERILLMALYASGARNAELTHLKVSDIDSQRMVVHMFREPTHCKWCADELTAETLALTFDELIQHGGDPNIENVVAICKYCFFFNAEPLARTSRFL
jgi:site-specific recombinase XerD